MALQCGIVGLPNVGKSTLFNCLSNAKAQAANFPFCTIEPNVGVITVPDSRLNKIAELVKPNKMVPTTIEIVDIAITNYPFSYKFASKEIKNNYNLALKVVKLKGYVLKLLPYEFRNNFNIVMEAITNNSNSFILFYASPELKDNYLIIKEAVKINGFRLKFSSNNLKKNSEICL